MEEKQFLQIFFNLKSEATSPLPCFIIFLTKHEFQVETETVGCCGQRMEMFLDISGMDCTLKSRMN